MTLNENFVNIKVVELIKMYNLYFLSSFHLTKFEQFKF